MSPSYFSRVLHCYRKSAVDAFNQLVMQPFLPILIFLGYLTVQLAESLIMNLQLGFLGGFALGLVQLSFISYVFKWFVLAREKRLPHPWKALQRAVGEDEDPWAHVRRKNRGLWFQEIFQFDSQMFLLIINAAFPIFLAEFVVDSLSSETLSLPSFVKLGIVLFFNPVPEVIMIERTNGVSALAEALQFMKKFIVEWLLPTVIILIICFSPYIVLSGNPLLWIEPLVLVLAGSELLLPMELVGRSIPQLALYLFPFSGVAANIAGLFLGLTLGAWHGLFRLELFERLKSIH
ncbi:MAG: hypothetical protein KDD70_03670 [Bdellovibrionales bacterium]|nr:hypothetical protein [Bdellovibrionales bacterium]